MRSQSLESCTSKKSFNAIYWNALNIHKNVSSIQREMNAYTVNLWNWNSNGPQFVTKIYIALEKCDRFENLKVIYRLLLFSTNKTDVKKRNTEAHFFPTSTRIFPIHRNENTPKFELKRSRHHLLDTIQNYICYENECRNRTKVFSINRRLAIIWPKSPYVCKTYSNHAHTCTVQKLT